MRSVIITLLKFLINTLGGWSNAGPTIVVETLDMPTKRWIQSDVKLFETPRAYHGVVNTGEDLYTIGGFNGAEYYRSTRKFNLKTRVCADIFFSYIIAID